MDLTPDGAWRRYEVEVRTRGYPKPSNKVFAPSARLFPSLRLWCIGMEQLVHLDDVCLTPLP